MYDGKGDADEDNNEADEAEEVVVVEVEGGRTALLCL